MNDNYYTGKLDDVQVSSVPRSSNWIWACYQNMASNGVFNSYGVAEANHPGLPQIADVGSQNVSDTSADVVGTLTTNGASTATVYLYWSTTDGTTNASSGRPAAAVSATSAPLRMAQRSPIR